MLQKLRTVQASKDYIVIHIPCHYDKPIIPDFLHPIRLYPPTMMMRLVALALAAAFTTANSGHNSSQPFNAVLLDTPLPMALSDLTATRVGEVVYIAGGCNSDTGNTFLDTIGEFVCDSIADTLYRFDPSTETFTQLASLPVGRYRHAAAATEGIYLVLLGGRDLNDDLIGTVDVCCCLIEINGTA